MAEILNRSASHLQRTDRQMVETGQALRVGMFTNMIINQSSKLATETCKGHKPQIMATPK
jgi:hypothetical protein